MYVHVGPDGLHGLYSRQNRNLMAFQMYQILTRTAGDNEDLPNIPPNGGAGVACAHSFIQSFYSFISFIQFIQFIHGSGASVSPRSSSSIIIMGRGPALPWHCSTADQRTWEGAGRLQGGAMDEIGIARGSKCDRRVNKLRPPSSSFEFLIPMSPNKSIKQNAPSSSAANSVQTSSNRSTAAHNRMLCWALFLISA